MQNGLNQMIDWLKKDPIKNARAIEKAEQIKASILAEMPVGFSSKDSLVKIANKKGAGTTATLLRLSANTKSIMVVRNKAWILSEAKRLNLHDEIPEPISHTDFARHIIAGEETLKPKNGYVIDDVESLIPLLTTYPIIGISLTVNH